MIGAATRVQAALRGDEPPIPGGIQAEPREHRLGTLGTGKGSDDWGFQVLSHSKKCQICPLPGAWGQPAPATPAGRPRTYTAGTQVHGSRAAASISES